jgi:hypothetical protein
MLKVEAVNLREIRELVEDMRDKLDAFTPISGEGLIAQELHNWQAEDMHRRYPETEEPDPRTVVTRIYPRSRKERRHRPRVGRARPRRPMVRIRRGVSLGGKRPILRPELFEKLGDRMARLMREKLKWR